MIRFTAITESSEMKLVAFAKNAQKKPFLLLIRPVAWRTSYFAVMGPMEIPARANAFCAQYPAPLLLSITLLAMIQLHSAMWVVLQIRPASSAILAQKPFLPVLIIPNASRIPWTAE